MTTTSEEQLTIHLSTDIKARLQAAAECKGVEVSRYCLDAIEHELAREETDAQEQTGKPYDFDSLFAFCDELLGGRRFSKTGLEYLHEARDVRARQMKEW